MNSIDSILKYVSTHPNSHLNNIMQGMGMEDTHSNNTNTRKKLNRLIKQGFIGTVKMPSERDSGKPMIIHYYVKGEE